MFLAPNKVIQLLCGVPLTHTNASCVVAHGNISVEAYILSCLCFISFALMVLFIFSSDQVCVVVCHPCGAELISNLENGGGAT